MEDAQRNFDGILESETDSQASDQVSKRGTRKTEEHSAAAIHMDALLTLMQTMKMASTEPKRRYNRPASMVRRTCCFS